MNETPRSEPRIEPVVVRLKGEPTREEAVKLGEEYAKRAAKALEYAKSNVPPPKPIEEEQPNIFQRIFSVFQNNAKQPVTTTVGLTEALISYYEALSHFMAGDVVFASFKFLQGTIALAIGVAARDPKLFHSKSKD